MTAIPSHTLDRERDAALSLLDSAAVRSRAHEMLAAAREERLAHFTVDEGGLPGLADLVAAVTRENYPDLRVPLHARWRHFAQGGRDLWAEIASAVDWRDAAHRARAEIDLAVVSVLLDAGAGSEWRFADDASGLTLGRSEGLALASLRMFAAGLFSAEPREPLRADAARLASISAEELERGFQAGPHNPMPGLDGRAALLRRLGKALMAAPDAFASADSPRPGGLFDHIRANIDSSGIAAPDVLRLLLIQLGGIWPERLTLGALPLGDTWRHPAIRRDDLTDGLMPLHKLSQWLTYSLIEPLQRAGLEVADIDGLTALAEYRNGGLFIDSGVIRPRDDGLLAQPLAASSEPVVEWRALTVALIDTLLPLVRDRLGVGASQFPLGALLEGGTWAAGRRLARQKRVDGGPPLVIVSDGTIF